MAQFSIEQITDLTDRIFVELDHRFNVVVVRTDSGLDLRIYPRTEGELWDCPFVTFTVEEDEVIELEKTMIA